MNDLKSAIRQPLKNPGFTAAAGLTFALCWSANLTIFAMVNAALIRPLPFPNSDRLATMFPSHPGIGTKRTASSFAHLYGRQAGIDAFSHVAACQDGSHDEKQMEQVPAKKPDVFFVPTPQEAVEKMLEMAEIKRGDILYDLGCGDGRIVVTAAKKYGIRAVGVDVDPERVRESLENVRTNQVEHLVTIKQADIFELDFSEAAVVTLFLLPELNTRLKPQLRMLKPGSRILSYSFEMHRAKPDEVFRGKLDHEFGRPYTIFKWVVPWVEE